MPLNKLKRYNEHLDLLALSEQDRKKSLWGVFSRDFIENGDVNYRGKRICPTPQHNVIDIETTFSHLTTVIVDKKTKKREYDGHRACRLHWVKHHLLGKKTENMLIYSIEEPDGDRTYIYDREEKFVVVLEPLRKSNEYYLLSAYYVRGKDAMRNKFERKYENRLAEIL